MSGWSDEDCMARALELARAAAAAGEVPVGAVLIDATTREVLGAAANAPVGTHDPTAHAEILALRQAAERRRNYRLENTVLFVTLEPCVMCAGAIVHARVPRLVFGARDLRFGGVRSKFRLADHELLNHQVAVEEGLLGAECLAVLQEFFRSRRE